MKRRAETREERGGEAHAEADGEDSRVQRDEEPFGDVAAGDREGKQRIERPPRQTRPSAPPARNNTAVSTSSCRTSRPRLAPRAVRTRHSRERGTVRARIRFVTLVHATSRTSADGAQHQQQAVLGLSLQRCVVLSERHRPKATTGVGLGVVERQTARHGVERRLRACDRDARLQARDDVEILVRARLRIVGGDERPDDVGAEAEHVRRQHADDRARLIVDQDGAPDRCWIRTETAHPPGVREQGDAWASGVEVLGEEGAAEERRDAERVEPSVVTIAPPTASRGPLPIRTSRSPPSSAATRSNTSCCAVRSMKSAHETSSGGWLGVGAPDLDESRRVVVRQRPEHDRVDQREDGRAGADADRDRSRSRGRRSPCS